MNNINLNCSIAPDFLEDYIKFCNEHAGITLDMNQQINTVSNMTNYNYIQEVEKLPYTKQKEYITATPMMVEKMEIEQLSGTHNTNVNGVDGWLVDGSPIEIKSQIFSGSYELRGRAKYGSPSIYIHRKKLDTNEKTIVVGAMEDGDLVYRFSYDFSAVSEKYLKSANMRKTQSNVDMLPIHYINHESFKVHYVLEPKKLRQLYNNYCIQPKFYHLLNKLRNDIEDFIN